MYSRSKAWPVTVYIYTPYHGSTRVRYMQYIEYVGGGGGNNVPHVKYACDAIGKGSPVQVIAHNIID